MSNVQNNTRRQFSVFAFYKKKTETKTGVSTRVRRVHGGIKAIGLMYHTYCHLLNDKRIVEAV